MSSRTHTAILALIAALAPGTVSAALIFSDIDFVADTFFNTGFSPLVRNGESVSVPNQGTGGANALTLAPGALLPNVPVASNINSAFASASIETALGDFVLSGVGANGFFLRNALPPNQLNATAFMDQSITNDSSTVTERLFVDLIIPAPTMRFFGVGDSPPNLPDDRDAFGRVEAFLEATLKRPDGSTAFRGNLLTYGMETFRDTQRQLRFSATPLSSASVGLTEFVEPDGAIVFRLPDLVKVDLALADIGPGETLELRYAFFATGSTGFGETGFFNAIGDPFDLSASGARFTLKSGNVVDPPTPSVSEPNTLAALGLGLALLGIPARRLRSRGQHQPQGKSA